MPTDQETPTKLKAEITDVWADGGHGEDEIRVNHPLGSCGFPYTDSSERRDQASNARAFAQKLFDEGKCAGIDDRIDAHEPLVIERPRS